MLGPLLAGEREGPEVGQNLPQSLERDRLSDEIERAELEACARLHLGGDARDDHDRHLGVADDWQIQELHAAHAGQADIEEDRVRSRARQRLDRVLGAADDGRLIAELGDEVAEDLGQPLVVLDDQDPHRAHSSATPQKTGSGVSRTPKRSATAVCTRRAKATTSRAFAPSRATIASACFVESPTGPSARPRV